MFARCRWCFLATLAVIASSTGIASAGFSFTAVTQNKAADVAIGQDQLSVDVTDAGGNRVAFTFRNSGPLASSITDVYFDDGELLSTISSFQDSGGGVDFSEGASPKNLPGGQAINFNTTKGLSADSNPPAQPNGVNPGEWLTVIFNLQNGITFESILDAIDLSLANPGVDMRGGLRIGIHVQGFAGGGSESFVNGPGPPPPPPPVVPAPPTIILAGLGILGFGGLARLRRRFTATR